MAVGVRGVNLQVVAVHSRIPYSTIRRWAAEEHWPIIGRDPIDRRCKLYDWRQVAAAVTARQERDMAAA